MNKDSREAAAAAIVEGQRAASNLAELHERLRPAFARVEVHGQAGKYMSALLADLPRKNGWQIAEYVGDATPDRTQRLLNHAEVGMVEVLRASWPPVGSPLHQSAVGVHVRLVNTRATATNGGRALVVTPVHLPR